MIPRPDLLRAYGSFELVGPRSIKKNPTNESILSIKARILDILVDGQKSLGPLGL